MRNDWVPLSASALVIGVMSLVFGSLLNPADSGSTPADMLRVVNEDGSRWLAMAVMYVFASRRADPRDALGAHPVRPAGDAGWG